MQPGYYLRQVGPNSFSCQKLSQISVRIYSKDDAGEPIPSVLLSLSGDDGYRNNSVSWAGGSFHFDNLFPGNFYLRPLLKVLSFLVAFCPNRYYIFVSYPKAQLKHGIFSWELLPAFRISALSYLIQHCG